MSIYYDTVRDFADRMDSGLGRVSRRRLLYSPAAHCSNSVASSTFRRGCSTDCVTLNGRFVAVLTKFVVALARTVHAGGNR
jgi:hypothetical protein